MAWDRSKDEAAAESVETNRNAVPAAVPEQLTIGSGQELSIEPRYFTPITTWSEYGTAAAFEYREVINGRRNCDSVVTVPNEERARWFLQQGR